MASNSRKPIGVQFFNPDKSVFVATKDSTFCEKRKERKDRKERKERKEKKRKEEKRERREKEEREERRKKKNLCDFFTITTVKFNGCITIQKNSEVAVKNAYVMVEKLFILVKSENQVRRNTILQSLELIEL